MNPAARLAQALRQDANELDHRSDRVTDDAEHLRDRADRLDGQQLRVPDDVTALFKAATANVVAVHGEPRIGNDQPVVLPGLTAGSGQRARLSASWHINGGWHVFAVDWHGPSRVHVETTSQTSRVGVFELWVSRLDAGDLAQALAAVGILPDGGEPVW